MIVSWRPYPFRLTVGCGCPEERTAQWRIEFEDPNPKEWKVFHGAIECTPIASGPYVLGVYRCRHCGNYFLTPREIGIVFTLWDAGGSEAIRSWLSGQMEPAEVELVFSWHTNRNDEWGWWVELAEDVEERKWSPPNKVYWEGPSGFDQEDPWRALLMFQLLLI